MNTNTNTKIETNRNTNGRLRGMRVMQEVGCKPVCLTHPSQKVPWLACRDGLLHARMLFAWTFFQTHTLQMQTFTFLSIDSPYRLTSYDIGCMPYSVWFFTGFCMKLLRQSPFAQKIPILPNFVA